MRYARSLANREAPEVLGKAKKKQVYTTSADVYSFAMVLFEMSTGQEPFPEITDLFELIKEVCEKHFRPKVPKTVPSPIVSLMKSCWSHDYKKRPTFPKIIEMLRSAQAKVEKKMKK